MADDYEYMDDICLIRTSKYKTIELFLNFSIPYDLKTFLCLRMLDSYLGDYSLKYPDKEKMSKAKDDLYWGSDKLCHQDQGRSHRILHQIFFYRSEILK